MNFGHEKPPNIQRPSSSARSPPLAKCGETEKIEDPPGARSGHDSARCEQPFNLLEPEAGVARPLVDLDPRRALVVQDCFQHGAPRNACTPPTRGREAELLKYAVLLRDTV
jgi:hypothetical protein